MAVTAASQKVAIAVPQPQSPFFRLARETRDDIYEYAFGHETISFNYRSLNIGASTKNSNEAIAYPGLPRWLLTCHAICSEAVEAFFRTRYFSPRYRRAKHSTTSNSLFLNKDSIRNIKVECPYSPFLLEADDIDETHEAPFRMFLQTMQPYLAPKLVLVIVWARYGQDWSVARERAMFENWPKRLRGTFRKVEIDVLVRREEDDEQCLKRMQNAEEFARNLIGGGEEDIRVSWGEKKDLGIVSQKPCVRCGWVHGERVLREVRRLITL
ncbi:hypothetical protein FB567DRAFT_510442 [Paraphoma chrysanthemicola]|uniref:Uncharacterized protein n=1 Tax=Paraphoma chrysanthemicola TaxID=798071 RepID=A0A8K0RIN4_9PLEO|nr:hypothetical protein FB567DRAFT_510442 [Paraphoma chrysanthemicola]